MNIADIIELLKEISLIDNDETSQYTNDIQEAINTLERMYKSESGKH